MSSSARPISLRGIPGLEHDVQVTPGDPANTVGSDLVTVLSWTAVYAGEMLQITAAVRPVNAADSIHSLFVGAGPTSDPFLTLTGSLAAVFDGHAPGATVAATATNGLWDPATNGAQVSASISGFIHSGGSSQSYGFTQTMTVATPGQPSPQG
jgi:hypothetical protein